MLKVPWCHIIFSIIGILAGIAGSILFFVCGNSGATYWSFLSACLAGLNLHLLYLEITGNLEVWHSLATIGTLKTFSMTLFILASGVILWLSIRIVHEHLSIFPVKDSLIITTVWTIMSAGRALILYRTSKTLQKQLDESFTRLLI